jgi:hypothetical protein
MNYGEEHESNSNGFPFYAVTAVIIFAVLAIIAVAHAENVKQRSAVREKVLYEHIGWLETRVKEKTEFIDKTCRIFGE